MRLLRPLLRGFADEVTPDFRVKPKTFLELIKQNKALTPAQVRWNNVLKRGETKAKDEPRIDLHENFLYGFKKEDFVGHSPILKQAFSIAHATERQLMRFKREAAVRKFQSDYLDTGSPQVQVVCMTERIIQNVNHCIKNNKDHKAKRKLQELMHRRTKMLHVLKRTNPNYYVWIVRDYNIQQSQKKVESYSVVPRCYKLPVTARKRFMYRSYNTTGFRIKDIQRESNAAKIARQKHD